MDIQKSFSFQFEDQDWINKLGLGTLISLVPLLNFAWSGYMVDIVRNVIDGSARPLPNWDDLGKKFTDGLLLALASLIYMLPVLLLLGIPLTMLVFSGLLSGSQDLRDISGILASTGGIFATLAGCFAFLYAVAFSFIYPAMLLVFARERTFGSCFQFRRILDVITRDPGRYLTVWGISIVAGLVVGMVVSIVTSLIGWIPCIGWAIAIILSLGSTVYISSIHAHLVGQLGAATAPAENIITVS